MVEENGEEAEQPRSIMFIVWSEQDQCYLVGLPEWAGHPMNYNKAAHGATYEEAAKNGTEVLRMLAKDPEAVAWQKAQKAMLAEPVNEDEEEIEQDDDDPLPPEYYAELRRRATARHEALGLMDLPEGTRDFCECMAEQKIQREGIEDAEAKQAVYAEVKQVVLDTVEDIREGVAADVAIVAASAVARNMIEGTKEHC